MHFHLVSIFSKLGHKLKSIKVARPKPPRSPSLSPIRCSSFCCKSKTQEEPKLPKFLYVFNFDSTIIDGESSQIFKKLVEEKKDLGLKIEMEEPEGKCKWTKVTRLLMDYVFDECDITVEEVMQALKDIPFVPGMEQVLKTFRETVLKDYEESKVVILSSSNDLFINTKLAQIEAETDGIISHFATIFRNKEDHTKLHYRTFAQRLYGKKLPKCRLCSKVMCKGKELANCFNEKDETYDQIHFICDGVNDLCPALRLREEDILYVREGFGLDDLIESAEEDGKPLGIKATIVYWNDGIDLLKKLIEGDFSTDSDTSTDSSGGSDQEIDELSVI